MKIKYYLKFFLFSADSIWNFKYYQACGNAGTSSRPATILCRANPNDGTNAANDGANTPNDGTNAPNDGTNAWDDGANARNDVWTVLSAYVSKLCPLLLIILS